MPFCTANEPPASPALPCLATTGDSDGLRATSPAVVPLVHELVALSVRCMQAVVIREHFSTVGR